MAKWRASQKARRQLQTIEAASEIDRKPYHFDEGTHLLDINFCDKMLSPGLKRDLRYDTFNFWY